MADEAQHESTDGQAPSTAGLEQVAGIAEPDHKAEVEKWKAMSRKHEAQAKENAAAAKRLAELEDANKSELQRASDKATAAEARAAAAEAKATRYEVAAELGIQPKHLKYLSGSTREEIEASAKGILDDFSEIYSPSGTDASEGHAEGAPARPKEKLKSGSTGSGPEVPQLTRDDLKSMSSAEIVKAKEEGRLSALLGT